MVRRYTPEEKKRGFRITYWLGVAAIIALWVWGFKSYFSRYEYLHPDITWAAPGIEINVIKVKGLLLWKETVLKAPAPGAVSFPLGKGPVRVARGAVVARVGGREVKAEQQGYFVAGSDGQESKWRYTALWQAGPEFFDKSVKLQFIADNAAVQRGETIGKRIEQPQSLRFVGYMTPAGDAEEQIKRKKFRVRMDIDDTVSMANISVAMKSGSLTKICVTMPWFQPDLVLSRNYTLTIDAGLTKGALVPMSAIVKKDGKNGVYLVRGARVIFTPVEGITAENDKFLTTGGISVGDAIVENAEDAREGKIQLW